MRTIKSPGIEITEKDLSLRVNTPAGTTVFVPGFAPQGPAGEPIQVTSVSELEAIFGAPTNSAERYFYYSCREILNSPAQLIAARLPYGSSGGTTHSSKYYSALLYPASLGNSTHHLTLTSDSALPPQEWLFGAPQHVTLTYDEYQALAARNFEWEGTSQNASPLFAIKNPDDDNNFRYFGDDTELTKQIYKKASNYPGSDATEYERLVEQKAVMLFDQAAIAAIVALNIPGFDQNYIDDQAISFNGTPGQAEFRVDTSDTTNPRYYVKAGMIVLNDIQSSINELSEGYYVGFADNFGSFADSPDFDSIKGIDTLTTVASATNAGERIESEFGAIQTARLEFALSATKTQSSLGVTSVSETLEKAGFMGFADRTYQDHLNFGVFRIRRSTVDPTKLALVPAEKYLGSLDQSRQTVNPAGGKPLNAFIEDIVNDASPAIRLDVNPAISNFGWTLGTSGTEPVARVTIAESAKKLSPLGVYIPDARASEQTKIIGDVPLKLDKLFRTIESPENVLIDVIIDAGLSTIFAATWKQADENGSGGTRVYVDTKTDTDFLTEYYFESWKTVAIPLITLAESTRKDCVAIIDPPRPLFIQGANSKVIDIIGNNFTQNIYNPLKKLTPVIESNYGAMYANWIKVNDIYTGRRYWHPSSAYAAAVFARSDAATQPWYAPAGLNRGTFNAIDIAFNPNQKQRDNLYEISNNPIVFFNGDGHVIMGQKTLQVKPSAFDRINVRRLFLTLERLVSQTVKYFVFEPNTQATRARLVNTIGPLFEFAKTNEGLYDYLIVCDERNNTPLTIDNNELIVDIYIKPVRAAEFILINFIATRTGQDFSELV